MTLCITQKLLMCFKLKTEIDKILKNFEEEEKNSIQTKLKKSLCEVKEQLDNEIDYLCSKI